MLCRVSPAAVQYKHRATTTDTHLPSPRPPHRQHCSCAQQSRRRPYARGSLIAVSAPPLHAPSPIDASSLSPKPCPRAATPQGCSGTLHSRPGARRVPVRPRAAAVQSRATVVSIPRPVAARHTAAGPSRHTAAQSQPTNKDAAAGTDQRAGGTGRLSWRPCLRQAHTHCSGGRRRRAAVSRTGRRRTCERMIRRRYAFGG